MKKTLLRILVIFGLLLAAFVLLVLLRQNRTFEAPYPALQASTDPALIARGRYLVYGPAHCGPCHGDAARLREADEGVTVPLSGGKLLDTPLAAFYAPNLTPDAETGIGRFRDEELARSLRYGVG